MQLALKMVGGATRQGMLGPQKQRDGIPWSLGEDRQPDNTCSS